MKTVKPPKLQPGDTIGICSPSGTIAHKRELFEGAKANFTKATGLKITVAPNTFNKHFYSAGTPEQRLSDFHGLLNDPNIKAVIFSAGGDTASDLIAKLDYDAIARQPKIIAGISDATTLLSAITAKTGLVTFLGLEFLDFANHAMEYELASLKKAWFTGHIGEIKPNPEWCELKNHRHNYTGWQTIRAGTAVGPLIGGNSESFIQLLGTEYELSPAGAVLFLETYKLPKKQIHKTCMQLEIRGVFEQIAGLLVGYCLDCENPEVVGNDQPLTDTILEVTTGYNFPIMQIGEIGHCVENCLQPLGAEVKLNATDQRFEITESVTT